MKRIIAYIVFFTLLLHGKLSFAQKPTNFGIRDGLPSNHVYKVAQDSEGFIWILTDNGLVKFDGDSFKEFTIKEGLPSNDIWELASSPDGKVWFFSKGSQVGYIYKDMVYSYGGEDASVFFPFRFVEVGSNVFFESNNEWYGLDRENHWRILPRNSPKDSLVNWIEGYQTFWDLRQAIDGVVDKQIIHLRAKDSLVFWLTKDHYHVLNLHTDKLVEGTSFLEKDRVYSVYGRIIFNNGQVQITDRNHLAILNPDFLVAETYEFPEVLNAHNSFLDRTGNLWSASFGNGLFKSSYTQKNIQLHLEDEKIAHITRLKQQIIAGVVDKGFYRWNPETKSFVPHFEKKGFPYPVSYVAQKNKVFFVDYLALQEDSISPSGALLPGHRIEINQGIKQMAFLDGFYWGLGSLNLKKIDPVSFEVLETLPLIGGNQFFPYQDRLLIATIKGVQSLKEGEISLFPLNEPLDGMAIHKIVAMDEDQILLLTEGFGVYEFSMNGPAIQIPNTKLYSVEDAYAEGKSLWLATDKGLLYYFKENGEYKFQYSVSEAEGLLSRKVNGISALGDQLFLATDLGIATIPKNLEVKSQFLGLYFDSMHFNGQPISEETPVRFTKNNSVGIQIGSIDFGGNNGNNAYEFRLLPLKKKWQETTSKQLNFNQLPPNRYVLEVQKNGIEQKVHFEILPLWWQRLWVQVLGGMVFLGLLIGLSVYLRKRDLMRKTFKIEQQKKMIEFELNALRSQMNPHFVFNSLSAIQNYINQSDLVASEVYLVKFSKLIRRFFELSKMNEITVAEECSLIQNYLEIEQMRFSEKLEFSVCVAPNVTAVTETLPTMLLQPIVENSVNHGIFNKQGTGRVDVSFEKQEDSGLVVTITDDGTGYDPAKSQGKKKLNATQVLTERIYYLNQTREWQVVYQRTDAFPEAANKGNKVTFTIKKIKA